MGLSREILLWASQNRWLKEHVPRWRFVRYSVRRFMPGESFEEALAAAHQFTEKGIHTVFTRLGENIRDLSEAKEVTDHYLHVLDRIAAEQLPAEISVKLTQLGFDISEEQTLANFLRLLQRAGKAGLFVWIDMEASPYVEKTLKFYEAVREEHENVGICLQAYLYRTEEDLRRLLQRPAAIRLVKGAYKEPKSVAFPRKKDVDRNFLKLSRLLLEEVDGNVIRSVFATHDVGLIEAIRQEAGHRGMKDGDLEVQMLYGIRSADQLRLAEAGLHVGVLISYGESWYPWYMRRLAERPANVWFVVKNLFVR
jgi:proline dehydrogenase